MRLLLTLGFFSALALSAEKNSGKTPPKPAAPKQGVQTPGVRIPFAGLTAEATLTPPDKPAWAFFLPDGGGAGGRGGAGGGGGRAGGGRGGAGGGGGRGAGAAPGGPAAPAAPAAGNVFLPAKDKLSKFETKTNKPADPIAGLKSPCGGMVSAFGSLWVPTCGDGSLQRIDARSSTITATIASGAADIPGAIAATADSVWLLSDTRETLSRIDPDQNAVVGEIRVPAGCGSLTFAETSLWLACPEQNKVLRINPATNVVDKRIEVAARPLRIAAGEGSIWVLCGKDGKVDRIDPKTDKVSKTIELAVPNIEGGIALSDGFVWVTMTGFPITRIDPVAETVAQQFWGEGGGAITASAGALWLSHLSGPNAGTVWRIDPKLILATLAE